MGKISHCTMIKSWCGQKDLCRLCTDLNIVVVVVYINDVSTTSRVFIMKMMDRKFYSFENFLCVVNQFRMKLLISAICYTFYYLESTPSINLLIPNRSKQVLLWVAEFTFWWPTKWLYVHMFSFYFLRLEAIQVQWNCVNSVNTVCRYFVSCHKIASDDL